MPSMEELLDQAKAVQYQTPSSSPIDWTEQDWEFAAMDITLHQPIQQQAMLLAAKRNAIIKASLVTSLKDYITRFSK